MIDLKEFDKAIKIGTKDKKMQETISAINVLLCNHTWIFQRWSWGWTFYIFLQGSTGTVKIQFADDDPELAMIFDLIVHPSTRGLGNGHTLLVLSEAVSKILGTEKIGLYADAGGWPRHWYERHGYKDDGRIHPKYDDIYMEKNL